MPVLSLDQEGLKDLVGRRHPEYEEATPHWLFCEQTYKGGREWFGDNIFRYIKEGEKEFKDRVDRAYRFNHTREIVDLIQKYIFKSPVARNWEDASDHVKNFWKKATLKGLDITQFMKVVSTESSKFGRTWVFLDNNKGREVLTVREEKRSGVRIYAYTVKPYNILDAGFDEDGGVSWVMVREFHRDDENPTDSGEIRERIRLWMKDYWYLFEIEKKDTGTKDDIVVKIVNEGVNQLGEVPGRPVDHVIGENNWTSPGLIDDIVYLDRATANYLSNLDAIIQDQTFSQLALPAQAVMKGSSDYDQMIEMGTKRIFTYDGEAGGQPQYLSPDVKQAQMIIVAINKIISEIYHTVGMAGERTKQDNAVGIDNSSGVAKAYDFERLNSLLTSKSNSLENCENWIVETIHKMTKQSEPEKELVRYPDTFDVRSLFDEFTVAERLLLIEAPDELRRAQMEQVVNKLFPTLPDDLKARIKKELKKWPEAIELKISSSMNGTPPTKFPARGTRKSGGNTPPNKNPATDDRQGQVTSGTQ